VNDTTTIETELARLDERYSKLRITQPRQERSIAESLRRLGQLMPIVAAERGEVLAVIDGFKRLHAAKAIGLLALRVRVVELEDRAALAALVTLNHGSPGLSDLEEAMVIRTLCREHGLDQAQIAELLGRHKSWVSRRLSLVERLSADVQDDVRAGLVSITVAREVVRLPRGNQGVVTAVIHQHGLTTRDAAALVGLFERAPGAEEQRYLLEHPREALAAQQRQAPAPAHDPRLGPETGGIRHRLLATLHAVTEMIARLEAAQPSRWTPTERLVLSPVVRQVQSGCTLLAEASRSLLGAIEKADANAA
jgi:ParB/RepB/Spo0J family partition protein